MQIPSLYSNASPLGGRGMFCAEDITANSVIEICPVVVVPANQMKQLKQTELYNYYFDWIDKAGAIALGYGSLYNHSYTPNAEYEADFEFQTLTIYALEDIPAGSEILFNYNGDPTDKTKVWFH